jgi:hypothetical protein
MVQQFRKHVTDAGVKIDEEAFAADLPFIKAMIRYDIDLSLFGVAQAGKTCSRPIRRPRRRSSSSTRLSG